MHAPLKFWFALVAALLVAGQGALLRAEDIFPSAWPVVGDEPAESDTASGLPAGAPRLEAQAPSASDEEVKPPDAKLQKRTATQTFSPPAATTGEPETAEKGQARATPPADAIAPLFVRSLTPISIGHNDSNPLWSPGGDLLAFERGIGDRREIVVARPDGTLVQTIYFEAEQDDGEFDFFFPGITATVSYNSGMSWLSDGRSLVFMSNGGSGNYDLYLLPSVGDETTMRLTRHAEKDSHPHWSPVSRRIVFVSGRSGMANVYTMDVAGRQVRKLTQGEKTYLYPQWSPDGQKIVMIYGSNENHDVMVIEDLAKKAVATRQLTAWAHDDLRPVWSPDGSKIAFYSNYNPQGDPKRWSLLVIAADGADSPDGQGLAACVVADNVVPDIERGPAWMPDNTHLIYVKNEEQAFNPLYKVNITTKTSVPIQTNTKMNHDVTCAADGTLAFRAQVEQWDHIYIAKLTEDTSPAKAAPQNATNEEPL